MKIRALQTDEVFFLKKMFYEALFVPEGQPPFPKDIIEQPELKKYIENWGAIDLDLALVAEIENELVGAIWGRTFEVTNPSYGFIDEATPEISMAIKSDFRGKGIGTKLIEKICKEYVQRNVKTLSLSVDKLNRAVGLYERMGFEIFEDAGTAWTMKKNLINN